MTDSTSSTSPTGHAGTPIGTATTHGARDHARAQAGSVAEHQRTVPATAATRLPDGVAAADMVWEETVEPGNYASAVLPRGARLRLTDPTGDTSVQLLLFNAAATAERLNPADTVKIQWQAYLGAGSLLLSDMGRVLASVLSDTARGHDLFNAMSNRAWNDERYHSGAVHGPAPNARDRFAVGLAKAGLGRRDIGPSIGLFKHTFVETDGSFTWHGHESPPGGEVVLRCELDLLVALTVTPHVLDPRPVYTVGPLQISAWRGEPTPPDDPVRTSSPERTRAFENTEEWLRQRVSAGAVDGFDPGVGGGA